MMEQGKKTTLPEQTVMDQVKQEVETGKSEEDEENKNDSEDISEPEKPKRGRTKGAE